MVEILSQMFEGPVATLIGITVVVVMGLRLLLINVGLAMPLNLAQGQVQAGGPNVLVYIWNQLPIPLKFFFSKCNEALYENRLSRFFIVPYVKLNYGHQDYLRNFRPAAGELTFQNFQSFFMREFLKLPDMPAKAVWPCEGLLCDRAKFDQPYRTSIKGEVKELKAVFGSQASKIPGEYEFLNVFLHNKDYHHIHSPIAGKVTALEWIHGNLLLLRPWFYRNNPSIPAMVNERLVVQISPEEGEPWWLAIVGGPAVGSLVLPGGLDIGADVAVGEKIASFRLGSTCCMAVPPGFRVSQNTGDRVDVFSSLT